MPGKLLYIVESISSGGAERQLVILMNELVNRGHEVHLITWVDNNHYQESDVPGVHWVKLQRKSILDLKFIQNLVRYSKRNAIEIVHGILDNGNIYAVTVKAFLPRIKCFLSERSSARPLPFLRGIYKRIIHGLPFVSTICNSEAGQDFIKKITLFPAKTIVVRNGFDLNRFRPASLEERLELRSTYKYNEDEFILLMVGRIIPLKRPHQVVRAFQKFYRQFPQSRLILLGDGKGKYKEDLNALIQSNPDSAGNIELVAAVKGVEEYYKFSDLYIHNSEREGSPNTLVEAMASGLPVLAAEAGDISYYLDGSNFEYWIEDGESDQILNYITEIREKSSEERLEIGRRNSQRIHKELHCQFHHMVENHLKVYGIK